MNNLMSAREVIENIIEDMKDTIDDYRDSEARSKSKLEAYNYRIRLTEVKRWKRSMEELLLELED